MREKRLELEEQVRKPRLVSEEQVSIWLSDSSLEQHVEPALTWIMEAGTCSMEGARFREYFEHQPRSGHLWV